MNASGLLAPQGKGRNQLSLLAAQTAPEELLCTLGIPVPNGTTQKGQEGTRTFLLAGTEKDAVTASIGTVALLSQTVHLGFFMS